jgi:hypothetical protein
MSNSYQSMVVIAVATALMTAFVQPRHIKLGLAGNEQNWPYAAYELEQLRETFGDVAEIMPKYRDLSIPDLTGLEQRFEESRVDLMAYGRTPWS